MSSRMDRLTSQLHHLPSIIGRLGISIAEAQKEFNSDYMDNIKTLMGVIKETIGSIGGDGATADEKVAVLKSILEALAPSRYQFTETTIEFSADLAETLDVGGSVAVGAGMQAITVNAAFSLGYGYDYRAAARIKSVIHAFNNPETNKALLQRAKEIDETKITLPERSEVEDEIWGSVKEVFASLK